MNKTAQAPTTYQYNIQDKVFIVTPVYSPKNGENINDILFKLMCCNEKEKSRKA